MRILHVYKDYWPVLGGIENHVKLLAERQVRAGHEVTVLATSPTRRTTIEELNGVRVIKAARLVSVASTPLSAALFCQLRAQRPEITHLHFPYPLGEIAHYVMGRGRKMVITYHSDIVRQRSLLRLYRPLMMRILASADRIIATTPNYVESSDVLRRLRARVVVVPFGIDQGRFRHIDREAATRLRARLGDGPLVLFVGVLRYYKGLDYLLSAMTRVPAPAKLVIVGSGPEGAALRREIETLGLGERVYLAGRVPDEALPLYYGAADLFCLPASARSEAFGLVQVEAMSAGLPVISTEVGTGVSYVNRDGESGLVVAPRDPDALAWAINRLLSDDALRQRLAAGARARADQFCAERMVEEIERVYEEVLAGS
ncbi:MAG: glycosyltransferase [Chloroflexi bacterium]|nr:glycosyltransferase [Chloroflexota bacterium]